MVTLDDIYGNADFWLIEKLHPNWEFYREDGVLKCRSKNGKKEEPSVGADALHDSLC